MKRGSYVSRSAFQKVCEENKRLKSDLYWLTMKGFDFEAIKIKDKWQQKFRQDAALNQALHDYAVKFIRDNPDSPAAQFANKFPAKK